MAGHFDPRRAKKSKIIARCILKPLVYEERLCTKAKDYACSHGAKNHMCSRIRSKASLLPAAIPHMLNVKPISLFPIESFALFGAEYRALAHINIEMIREQ